jgi:hypothetical protein
MVEGGCFFRGLSSDQDSRFGNKDKKLIASMTFPPEFEKKVDMNKVSMEIMTPWIANRITELLGVEDDIVVDYCMTQLEEGKTTPIDPKMLQINMQAFLARKAPKFTKELWEMLLSANESPIGVPKQLLDARKAEMMAKKQEADSLRDALQSQQEEEPRQRIVQGKKERGFAVAYDMSDIPDDLLMAQKPAQQRDPSPAPRSSGRRFTERERSRSRDRDRDRRRFRE